mmetsp:Transcript_854/g.1862  ORF Transcript_854/g.1862 Transcript_854/m.1862 type:complete len:259 (+) Transcript_854:1265-2041(+)
MEDLTPRHPLGQEPVYHLRHHDLGVLPVRVGNQREFLSCLPLVQQSERNLLVELDVLLRVPHHVCLEPAFYMSLEQSLGHRVEQLLVGKLHEVPGLRRDLESSRVKLLHELGVQASFRDGKERVEEEPSLLSQVHQLPPVDLVGLAVRQSAGAMHCPPHVAEAIDLDHVAKGLVDDEAAADELRVEVKVVHWETNLLQVLLGVVIRAALPLSDFVVDQRVVHVIADAPDAAKVQCSAAKHRSLRLCWQAPRLRCTPPI